LFLPHRCSSCAQARRQYKDPHASDPAIRADLAWAADGIGDYTAPKRIIKKRGAAEKDD
jgi:hypothetical protein